MVINDFSSYFEILAGINLGYTAFDYFRNQLNTKVFKVDKDLSKNFTSLQDRLLAQVSEDRSDIDTKTLKKLNKRVNTKYFKIDTEEKKERSFFEVLEPIAFLLALFCLSILLIGGCQQSHVESKLVFTEFTLVLSFLIFTFSLTIFIGSFSERVLLNSMKVSLSQIVIVFVFFILLSSLHIFNESNLKEYLIFSPIIIYLLIITYEVFKCEKYVERAKGENLKMLLTLCKKNLIPIVIYLFSITLIHYFFISYY